MTWTIKDLPQNIQNKPSHILEKGLAAANKALLNGKSNVEATLVCLGTTPGTVKLPASTLNIA